MSNDEDLIPFAGTARMRAKSETALGRLMAVAGRGVSDAALVVGLLESAAAAAEGHSVTNDLPAAEREIWSAVGARFDPRAQHANDKRLVDAFAVLVADSVVGDATLAELLGVDRSRVSQRLADKSLYAFVVGDERCFPRWQIANGKPIPGLKIVLANIDPGVHPLTIQHWFTTENLDLEIGACPVSPAVWLATGGDPHEAAILASDV